MHDKAQMIKNMSEKPESDNQTAWACGNKRGKKRDKICGSTALSVQDQKSRLIKQLAKAGFIHNAIHAALLLEEDARPGEVCKQG